MSTIRDFLSPLIEKDYNFKNLFKSFCRMFPILWHGLVPHKKAQNPQKEIPDLNISDEDKSAIQSTILDIYNESNSRIEHLEEKAFKLLTYISALSALILFFLSKVDSSFSKLLIIASLLLLFIAILLSLRCMGTKTRKSVFLDSVFDFSGSAPSVKDSNQIYKSYLDCAVYNQAVADNTADILKASRYFLTFAFIIAFLGISINVSKIDFSGKTQKEILVEFKDSTTLKSIDSSLVYLSEKLDSTFRINNSYLMRLDSIYSQIKVMNYINAYTQQAVIKNCGESAKKQQNDN